VAFTDRDAALELTDRPTMVRYQTVAWLVIAAALAYLCRNSVGVAESTIRSDLDLTKTQTGWFMGAFFWTYAIFQVPSGWFAERVGSRAALSVFALGWSAAMFGMAIAPGFWLLVVAQLMMGIAQAGLMPAACDSIGRWMPLAQRSIACGFVAAGMAVGAIAASGLSGVAMLSWGWRSVFAAYALPGIIWTIGFFGRFRDNPSDVLPPDSRELALIRSGRNVEDLNSQGVSRESSELLAIARSPNMWWLCGQQICRAAGYMFFASWFPTFLQETRGVTVKESGYLQGVVLSGGLLGAIFGGLLTDRILRRTGSLRASRSGVGVASLTGCSFLILAAWFVQSTGVAVFLLAVGNFCAAFAGPCAFAAIIDISGPRVPQVAGMMNMSGNLAAAACPILVAQLFEWTKNWELSLLLFAGVYLCGAICWLAIDPQRRIVYGRPR
jgi:ACS family glucarate transporter-like MFS transporter/ACS family D-galactonate transporter-like MFS transporter